MYSVSHHLWRDGRDSDHCKLTVRYLEFTDPKADYFMEDTLILLLKNHMAPQGNASLSLE